MENLMIKLLRHYWITETWKIVHQPIECMTLLWKKVDLEIFSLMKSFNKLMSDIRAYNKID